MEALGISHRFQTLDAYAKSIVHENGLIQKPLSYCQAIVSTRLNQLYSLVLYGSNVCNVEEIVMSYLQHSNSCQLTNLKHFELIDSSVGSIPFIPHLNQLTLRRLNRLKTIPTEYKSLQKLLIGECPQITSIEIELRKIPEIQVCSTNFTDFSELYQTKKLIISNYPNWPLVTLPELTEFSRLQHLVLDSIWSITSLSADPFGNIPILELIYLPRLTSLNGLGFKNKSITLAHLRGGVDDFTPIKNVPKVTILDCPGFTNTTEVDGVTDLTIIGSGETLDFRPLRNVKKLSVLSTRYEVTNCVGLDGVGQIEILNLTGINLNHLDSFGDIGVANKKVILRGGRHLLIDLNDRFAALGGNRILEHYKLMNKEIHYHHGAMTKDNHLTAKWFTYTFVRK